MSLPIRIESIAQDLLYALRGFQRSPGPFWIAVLTIALGAGGATAVFSVVDRILFRSLPCAHQDRLMWFGMKAPINNNEFLIEGDYERFRRHNRVFGGMGAIARVSDCDLNEQDSLRLSCAQVTADLLPALGVAAQIGRNFEPGDWQRRFGSDPSALGRSLVIDGRPARIVGVLRRDFELPALARVDVLLPAQLNPGADDIPHRAWPPQARH